jgi:hypothetical protein
MSSAPPTPAKGGMDVAAMTGIPSLPGIERRLANPKPVTYLKVNYFHKIPVILHNGL